MLQLHIQDFSFQRTMSHLSPQPGSSTLRPSSCIFIMPQRAQHGVCKLARQERVGILIIALSEKNPRDTCTVSLPTPSLSRVRLLSLPSASSVPQSRKMSHGTREASQWKNQVSVFLSLPPSAFASSPLRLELSHFAFPKNGWSGLTVPWPPSCVLSRLPGSVWGILCSLSHR